MTGTSTALALVLTLWCAGDAWAQTVVNPATARLEFASPDQPNATLVSYQAVVFPAAANPATGTPVLSGPVITKTLATVSGATTPPTYSLTFAQLGVTVAALPPCTVVAPAPCPAYSVLLVASGPGGASQWGVTSESDPFALAPLNPAPPANPSAVKVKAQ